MDLITSIFWVLFLFAMAWCSLVILAIVFSMGERRPPRRARNPFAAPVQNQRTIKIWPTGLIVSVR